MSQIVASIRDIKKSGALHLIEFNLEDKSLFMISLELNKSIKKGIKVKLIIKPFSIVLAKDFIGEISYLNRLEVKIKSIEIGDILTNIELECSNYILESTVTTKSLNSMSLRKGDTILALIRATDISILEVID